MNLYVKIDSARRHSFDHSFIDGKTTIYVESRREVQDRIKDLERRGILAPGEGVNIIMCD